MCEKRTRKIKKGSQLTRLREARRLQRLQRLSSSPTTSDHNTRVSVAVTPCPVPTVDKAAQNRVILELAWKTVALMHKNRLIQQKINALKKETSEFVAAIMSNPENRKRYIENLRLYGPMAQAQMVKLGPMAQTQMVKLGPMAQTQMVKLGPMAQTQMVKLGPMAQTQMVKLENVPIKVEPDV